MNKLALLVVLATTACTPSAYYVANVYRDGNEMYVQRCAIDAGYDRDKPDPANCRYERVHDLPPDVRPHVQDERNAVPAPDSPPAPAAAIPTPATPATPAPAPAPGY